MRVRWTNKGFPKTSEVEFRGFLGDPEVPEPAGETAGPYSLFLILHFAFRASHFAFFLFILDNG